LLNYHYLTRNANYQRAIIGTLGDPNLRAFVIPTSIPESLNKADCVQFRCRSDAVSAEYICWLMNMPSTLIIAASLIQGITRTRISMGRLRELIVPVPPLVTQQKFSQRVEQIHSIQSQQSIALEKAEAIFQSLLHRAFAGQL
jgi:type I restriction enzyme S subunit